MTDTAIATLDRVEEIRDQFPILEREIDGNSLGLSGQRRQQPEADSRFWRRWTVTIDNNNANVHRGAHTLSQEATAEYENARLRVARFINAPSDKQIIFTDGTTEGINLVAYAWGRANLGPGDEVLITEMEHHSNIVPWQILRDELGFTLRYIPITE